MRSGPMPKTQSEDDKKHGDKLQPLIERTRGSASSRNGKESDDDGEGVQNDDVDTDRDVGERE
jgi:hypothetical protein